MSIPPLVCSTPPPPEQCEDDKDHEDFDLSYNLSQEDDEDSTEYTYGNYSTYSAYQTATEKPDELKWPPTLIEHTESIDKCSIKTEINSSIKITPVSLDHVSTPKYEEAVLEDLNLIVDNNNEDSADQDQPSSHEKIKDEINNSDSSDTDSRIIDQGTSDVKQDDLSPPLVSSESIDDAYFNEDICDKETQNTQGVCEEECVKDILSESLRNDNELSENIVEDDQFSFSNGLMSENVINSEIEEKSVIEVNAIINNDDVDDDGFGDFEDFKITSTQSNQVLPITSENPWDSRNNESPGFTEFKASFDENKPDEEFGNMSTKVDDLEIDNTIGNDEFGDFDDFKSSGNNEEIAEETQGIITPNVSVWNLNSPDNESQIVDSISGLLAPIFTEEITEPENDVVGKLETFLSETWGHLVDIDVRQPYMINWNNSLGQKTLLKALCIDSRNILFGPKWHYNMPKYAANLTTAPLQPQKQVAHSSSANLETNEKINKEANTWVDPFTQDGQESCNTENESASEPAKRPTDLEVFSEPPADISKIYSSTIKVQPVRHINLPDTHIFTPTDSETPRSKTIHYDTESNPVQIPAIENKIEAAKLPSDSQEFIENEYWEFQDFKGTTTDVPTNTVLPTEIKEPQTLPVNTQSNQGITYQTQILQPIKMEPIMPTLNWPDPGEVKETFDDFSDFISSTTWSVDKENKISALVNQKDDLESKEPKEVMKLKSENIDDDFETFQTAPSAPVLTEFRLDTFTSPQISSLNVNPKNVVENYNIPPITMESKGTKIDNNSIKIENKSPPFQQNSANDSVFKPNSSVNPGKHMNADILLPTNAGSSGINRSQQNSGQILQPLSLEGYSQINWPNPGIDLQDLSRFNPVDSVHTIKNDTTVSGNSKGSSPAHNTIITHKEISDDDIWGDFVSSAPKPQQATPKKIPTFADDDEWTDFVSSPSVKPLNGLSTISLNVHTNLNMQKSKSNKMAARNNQIQLDIPTLNYITPKSNNRGIYTEKHFQNL